MPLGTIRPQLIYSPTMLARIFNVLIGVLVDEINWSSARSGHLVASGVTFTSCGMQYTVAANEEVVVGGSVNTPQILELSGIGAKALLDNAGVQQVIDLPSVCKNMQDHTTPMVIYDRKDKGVTVDSLCAITLPLLNSRWSSARTTTTPRAF
jgi:choline dehydrogenase-like flavoprotein